MSSLDIGANILKPFMPATADKILAEIGAVCRDAGSESCATSYKVTPEPQTLFERVNFEDIKGAISKIEEKQRMEAAPVDENKKQEITIDDFAKVEMRVGTVVACEAVKKSKLLHETISIGNAKISVLSGIAKHYTQIGRASCRERV